MYGNNCHDKGCLYNRNRKCCHPEKKMLMLCERPSRKEVSSIRQRIELELSVSRR